MTSLILYGVFAIGVIPVITLLFGLQGNLLKTNLSMLGNEPRHHVQFILWGILCAAFFYSMFSRTFALAGYTSRLGKTLLVAACISFVVCLFVPFLPKEHPVISTVHNVFAVGAPLLITAVSLLLALHLRGVDNRIFLYAIIMWGFLTAVYSGLMIKTGISGLFEVVVIITISVNMYAIMLALTLWKV